MSNYFKELNMINQPVHVGYDPLQLEEEPISRHVLVVDPLVMRYPELQEKLQTEPTFVEDVQLTVPCCGELKGNWQGMALKM